MTLFYCLEIFLDNLMKIAYYLRFFQCFLDIFCIQCTVSKYTFKLPFLKRENLMDCHNSHLNKSLAKSSFIWRLFHLSKSIFPLYFFQLVKGKKKQLIPEDWLYWCLKSCQHQNIKINIMKFEMTFYIWRLIFHTSDMHEIQLGF